MISLYYQYPLHWRTPKTLSGATIWDISYTSRVIANFALNSSNFHYHGNNGSQFNCLTPKIPFGASMWDISLIQAELQPIQTSGHYGNK